MTRKSSYAMLLGMLCLFCAGNFLLGCNRAEEPVQTVVVDCAALLDSRCQACHSLTRICQALGAKSQGNWESIIKTMVGRGAQLDKPEQKALALCLAQKAPEVEALCRSLGAE